MKRYKHIKRDGAPSGRGVSHKARPYREVHEADYKAIMRVYRAAERWNRYQVYEKADLAKWDWLCEDLNLAVERAEREK